MNIARLSFLGLILQITLLAIFILFSQSFYAQIAKPIVLGVAVLSMSGFFLYAARVHTIRLLIFLSGLLAIGYIVEFHLLGFIFFPSLLKDLDGLSMDYLQSVLVVTATLFVVYVITALIFFGLSAS